MLLEEKASWKGEGGGRSLEENEMTFWKDKRAPRGIDRRCDSW